MTDHTTHFDDCGCKSKRLEAERDALRLRVAALEAALDDARKSMHRLWDAFVVPRTYDPQRESDALKRVQAALVAGDTTALRAMLVDGIAAYCEHVELLERGRVEAAQRPGWRAEAEKFVAEWNLGASKEGGE